MFSVMIGLVPLVLLAVWKLTWPKTAVFLVALLWLVVALFMLIGTGALWVAGLGVHPPPACSACKQREPLLAVSFSA